MTSYVNIPEGESPSTIKCKSVDCNETFTIIGKVGFIEVMCIKCFNNNLAKLRKLAGFDEEDEMQVILEQNKK